MLRKKGKGVIEGRRAATPGAFHNNKAEKKRPKGKRKAHRSRPTAPLLQ